MLTKEEKTVLKMIGEKDLRYFDDMKRIIGFADKGAPAEVVHSKINFAIEISTLFDTSAEFTIRCLTGRSEFPEKIGMLDRRNFSSMATAIFLRTLDPFLLFSLFVSLFELAYDVKLDRLHDLYGVGAENLPGVTEDLSNILKRLSCEFSEDDDSGKFVINMNKSSVVS